MKMGDLTASWRRLDENIQKIVAEILSPSARCGLVEIPVSQQGWRPENWDKQDHVWNWGMVNLGSPKLEP